jgi:pimeloyl-ACP methyl ester carboxylesterase
VTRLVLLHGAPGDGSLWRPVVEFIRADVEVLTPTLRWFGPEPWTDDGAQFGTRTHTEQLIRLLEALDGPAAVASWSYSTHVVLNALLQRPELIGRAFLYEPGLASYLERPDERAAFEGDASAAFGPIFAALHAGGPEAAVEALFDSTGGAGGFQALSPGRRSRYLAGAGMMPLLLGGGEPPAEITAQDLRAIRTPVTVAMGEGTRPLFRIASRAVAREIPGAKLLVLPGADHMLPEADPARFAGALDRWLALDGRYVSR